MPNYDPIVRIMCQEHNIPFPAKEYKFNVMAKNPVRSAKGRIRKWSFDYCWINKMTAMEIEGSVWTQGRHTRGAGFIKDMEKYNEAAIAGWCLLRCTPDQLEEFYIAPFIKRALGLEQS